MLALKREREEQTDQAIARTLGVTSLAIGLTELFATKQVEKVIGLGNGQTSGVIRALGVREVLHGVDLLSHDDPRPGVASRLAGDGLDGLLLGLAAIRTKRPAAFMAVTAAVLGVVAADVLFASRLASRSR